MALYEMNSFTLLNRKVFEFNLKIPLNSKKKPLVKKFLNDDNYMISIKI